MRLLVTGASGFIAKSFIKYSLKKNIQIIAISKRKKVYSHKNLKWIKGQFSKCNLKSIGKFDILVHFASYGTKPNDRNNLKQNFKINVFNSKDLILSAIKNNCKKFVIISSSSEFGTKNIKPYGVKKNDFKIPNDSYGLSKLIIANIARNYSKKYKCKFRIMRLFPVYGEGENPRRIYSIVKKCSNKNKNLFDALNFNKNKFKYHQTYHVSESNRLSVLEFCKILWKKFNCRGKIIYRNKKKQLTNHISHKSSNWRL